MSRVALVTGASTGIGHAAALALGRRGHEVWATMRDLERAEDLRRRAHDERLALRWLALDVTSDESVARAVEHAIRTSGRLDALVANAGFHDGAAVEDTPLETFRALFETNTLGLVRCVKAVLPHMRERGSGCIVGVTSQSGRFVHPANAAYAGSKFATEAVLEGLALEVARFGMRVAIVEPGLTFTAAQSKAKPRPQGTPYEPLYARMGAIYGRDARDGSSAALVGDAIADAVESNEPRLRWVVGRDAERNLVTRARCTDEEWIELHTLRSDAEFFERWAQRIGVDPADFSRKEDAR